VSVPKKKRTRPSGMLCRAALF